MIPRQFIHQEGNRMLGRRCCYWCVHTVSIRASEVTKQILNFEMLIFYTFSCISIDKHHKQNKIAIRLFPLGNTGWQHIQDEKAALTMIHGPNPVYCLLFINDFLLQHGCTCRHLIYSYPHTKIAH